MSEDDDTQQTTQMQPDEGDVAAQTHARGCKCSQEAARRRKRQHRNEREGIAAFGEIVEAHQSVKEEWTEHYDRPEDIRDEVWFDPLFTPLNPTDTERRFIETRRIRRRTLRWKRGGSS